MSFTLEQADIMKEVYFYKSNVQGLIDDGYDLHQEFADRTGLPRKDAKHLFYEINYTFSLGYSKFLT